MAGKPKRLVVSNSFSRGEVNLLQLIFNKIDCMNNFEIIRRSSYYVSLRRKALHMQRRYQEHKDE